MDKKNIFYRLCKKFKKTIAKKIFGNKFFYKHFPGLFLWVNFDNTANPNTASYWSERHGNEETGMLASRFDNFVLSFLDRIDFQNKDILDVGCGRGIFLSQIKNARSRTGVDISEVAAKIAEQKGINTFVRTLPNLNLGEKFDIITCFETLEHTFEWKKSLEEMLKSLRPEGFLIISIPFEDGIPISEHVSYFDIPRLFNFLRNKTSVLEIKIIGPWLLIIAQNKKYSSADRPEYFFKK